MTANNVVGASKKYREIRKLGSGGAGYVALAVDASGRKVAIKRPHPHLFDDPRALAAFQREIGVVSRLRQENVVTLYTSETLGTGEGAIPELVLEYVDGMTLGELVAVWRAEERKDPGAALSVVRDVARGLSAVHELKGETGEPLGLVHRDVSPHNILVGKDGVAKLTDFGLARALARGDRSTTGGVLKGKAGYLAPEYIRGAPIDARVDIFALGIVLWESLVRERLFSEENEAVTLQKILTTVPPPIAAKDVNLGAAQNDVQMILDRATSRSPSMRYATAREMADDIERAIAVHQLWADRETVAASFGKATIAKLAERAKLDDRVDQTLRAAAKNKRVPWIALVLVSPMLMVAIGKTVGRAFKPPSLARPDVSIAPPVTAPSASDVPSPPTIDPAALSPTVPAPSSPSPTSASASPALAPLASPSHRPSSAPKPPRRNPY